MNLIISGRVQYVELAIDDSYNQEFDPEEGRRDEDSEARNDDTMVGQSQLRSGGGEGAKLPEPTLLARAPKEREVELLRGNDLLIAVVAGLGARRLVWIWAFCIFIEVLIDSYFIRIIVSQSDFESSCMGVDLIDKVPLIP